MNIHFKTVNIHRFRFREYADNAKVFFVIRDARDSALLQLEIDKFLGWASANGLTVNNNKCNFISLTRGSLNVQTAYTEKIMGSL